MPWEIVSPRDGQPCGTKYVRGAAEADNPALVFDTVPDGAVWDAASGKPRPVNDAEKLGAAKEAKRAELALTFVSANTALYPETAPEYAIWLAVPEYAATPNAQRPQAIRTNIARLTVRLAAVNTATTVEAVVAVVW